MRRIPHVFAATMFTAFSAAGADFLPGDFVRLTRRETLQAAGKNLVTVPKGGEFIVVKRDGERVQLEYLSDYGSPVAASAAAEALEAVPVDAWADVLAGVGAFRDQRHDEARRRLARAATDARQKAMAAALLSRIAGALTAATAARTGTPAGKQAFANTLQSLRDAAAQFAQAGHVSISAALDEGTDRLGGAGAPVSKLDRADITQRAKTSATSLARGRQSLALRRINDALKHIEAGLAAEPANPLLKNLQARAKKELSAADECFADADKLRERGQKGVIHALSSLDDGLRLCADHPKLLALKKEMQAEFEKRTSPQVTPAFIATAKAKTPKETLAAGRELYVNRCTECHDLEMLDSRGLNGWQRTVGGMSRRAGLSTAEQAQVLDYIAAAITAVEAGDAQ